MSEIEEKPAKKKSKFALPDKKVIISKESALPQVLMLLDRYGIDVEAIEDDRARQAQENQANEILNRVMSGEIEIYDEDGQIKVKQNLKNRSKDSNVEFIVYGELNGEHHQLYNVEKEDNGFKAMHNLLSMMAETNGVSGILKKLRSSDLKTAELLATFFL